MSYLDTACMLISVKKTIIAFCLKFITYITLETYRETQILVII